MMAIYKGKLFIHYKVGHSDSAHLKKAKGLGNVFYIHSDFM